MSFTYKIVLIFLSCLFTLLAQAKPTLLQYNLSRSTQIVAEVETDSKTGDLKVKLLMYQKALGHTPITIFDPYHPKDNDVNSRYFSNTVYLPTPDLIVGELPKMVVFDTHTSSDNNLRSDGFFIIRSELNKTFNGTKVIEVDALDVITTRNHLMPLRFRFNELKSTTDLPYRNYQFRKIAIDEQQESDNLLISSFDFNPSQKTNNFKSNGIISISAGIRAYYQINTDQYLLANGTYTKTAFNYTTSTESYLLNGLKQFESYSNMSTDPMHDTSSIKSFDPLLFYQGYFGFRMTNDQIAIQSKQSHELREQLDLGAFKISGRNSTAQPETNPNYASINQLYINTVNQNQPIDNTRTSDSLDTRVDLDPITEKYFSDSQIMNHYSSSDDVNFLTKKVLKKERKGNFDTYFFEVSFQHNSSTATQYNSVNEINLKSQKHVWAIVVNTDTKSIVYVNGLSHYQKDYQQNRTPEQIAAQEKEARRLTPEKDVLFQRHMKNMSQILNCEALFTH